MRIFIPRANDELILNQDFLIKIGPYKDRRDFLLKKGTILKVNSLDGRFNHENINLKVKGIRDIISVPIKEFNNVDCELLVKRTREIHVLKYPPNDRMYRKIHSSTSRNGLISKLRKWKSHQSIFFEEINPILQMRDIYRPDYGDSGYWDLKELYNESFDEELRKLKGITSWNQLLDYLPPGYQYEVREIE